ncbi:MAG: hypothetical protein JSW12_19955 [Deltaproteobacteria bacterium]|nr:MAG: hypothetical protein JSW12_19955 [Deltaproteobacteria bacterium]
MSEIVGSFLRYHLGPLYRRALITISFLLIFFHVFVILLPFLTCFNIECDPQRIKHLRDISVSLTNITAAVILILLVVTGQESIRRVTKIRRNRLYDSIGSQISDWFEITGSNFFHESVISTDDPDKRKIDILRHFKVTGYAENIIKICNIGEIHLDHIRQYCENVHFELTIYPSEVLYGIHFEFFDSSLNFALYEKLTEILSISKQFGDFGIDQNTPKKPSWLFFTRNIKITGDPDKDLPEVMTHSRHFVELVGHTYDLVYGCEMILYYLKKDEKNAATNDPQ